MKEFFDFFKGNFFIKIILFIYALFTSWFSNAQINEIPKYSLEKQSDLLSDNIEFFHDIGGLSNSKDEIIGSIKKNICGKVTRTLINGSIEVYPIKDYGAVEIGYHKFFNNQEPNQKSIPSKFIAIWKKENKKWQMTKIVSLH